MITAWGTSGTPQDFCAQSHFVVVAGKTRLTSEKQHKIHVQSYFVPLNYLWYTRILNLYSPIETYRRHGVRIEWSKVFSTDNLVNSTGHTSSWKESASLTVSRRFWNDILVSDVRVKNRVGMQLVESPQLYTFYNMIGCCHTWPDTRSAFRQ